MKGYMKKTAICGNCVPVPMAEAIKLSSPDQRTEQLARQMLLAEINSGRSAARKHLLLKLPPARWRSHGPKALEKARAMKIVTIISLWSKLRKPLPPPPPIQYDVLAQDGDVATTLEDAYAVTNMDGRPMGRQAWATTTGDMMLLDGKHYLVEPHGFRELTDAEAQAIKQLDCRETCGGYDRLVENRLI